MIEILGIQIAQLTDLKRPAAQDDPQRFETEIGKAFLVLQGGLAALKPPDGPTRTMMMEADTIGERKRPLHDALVWPLKQSGKTAYASMLSIGRTGNNDVPIPDKTVSKLAALMTPDGDNFRVKQAGDAPVFVNDDELFKSARGTPLSSGDTLRVGGVELTYMSAQAVRALCMRI